MYTHEKLAVKVKAIQVTEDFVSIIKPRWLMNAFYKKKWDYLYLNNVFAGVTVYTLEGKLDCVIGNWVISGIENELHPVENSIFKKTYKALGG